jgi:hypothetical protein
MVQLMSKKLPHTLENVCLSTDEECQMYAVGSKAHTDLLDSRTLQVAVVNFLNRPIPAPLPANYSMDCTP